MATQRRARGVQGRKGERGARGLQGRRGKTGKTGPPGPKIKGAEILAIVKEQYFDERFSEIHKHLEAQLRRTGELQAQVDELLRRLASERS